MPAYKRVRGNLCRSTGKGGLFMRCPKSVGKKKASSRKRKGTKGKKCVQKKMVYSKVLRKRVKRCVKFR